MQRRYTKESVTYAYKTVLQGLSKELSKVIPASKDITYTFSTKGGIYSFIWLPVGCCIDIQLTRDGRLEIVNVVDGAIRISDKDEKFYQTIIVAFTRFLQAIWNKQPVLDTIWFRLPMPISSIKVEFNLDDSVMLKVV